MREILFRGKDKKSGDWHYGSLVNRTKYYGEDDDKYFILEGGEFDCDYYDAYEVIPETIGQYTGFEDCYENKIFEGDFILYDSYDEYAGEVVYSDGAFSLMWSGNELLREDLDYWASCRRIKVIGNIFDNKEAQ